MRTHSRLAATRFAALWVPVLAVFVMLALPAGCGKDKTTTPIDAIVVPDDFPTPQAAVDAAQAGELVLVHPGTYFGSELRALSSSGDSVRASLFMKDGVRVLGEGAAGMVVLRDTSGAAGVVGVVLDSLGDGAVVQNLVFEDYHTGALVAGRSGVLIDNRFAATRVGIHVRRAGQPYVIGNLVEEADSVGILDDASSGAYGANLVRGCDVGMATDGSATPVYDSNVMCRNRVGFRALRGATPLMRGNAMRANGEVGVLLESGAIPDFKENDLYWNGVADLVVADYQPHLTTPLLARGNYWGADFTVAEIGLSRILDAIDDPSRGATVDYVPVSPAFFFDPSVDLNAACAGNTASELAAIARELAALSERLRFAVR